MNCWVAVGEGSDSVFREPCGFPCDFEGDIKDGGVLVFRTCAGEVVWCEAVVKVFCCEVVCFELIDVIDCFV